MGAGWREGPTSLLSVGQPLCKAALLSFEVTELLEEQVDAAASLQRALPRLWHISTATCSPASRSAWETPPLPHIPSAWQLRDVKSHPLEWIFKQ